LNKHYSYPVFLNLSGRPCVVIGGGKVALRKVNDLIETGALVTVVAEKPDSLIEELSQRGTIKLLRSLFKPKDMENAFLVIAATDDNSVNSEIAERAHQKGILVNAVDNPGQCDFFSGAVLKRGPLRIAISTSGRCPGIAAYIRRELEKQYSGSLSDYIETAGEMRQYILSAEDLHADKKDNALKWLCAEETLTLFVHSGKEKVWEELKKIISS